MFISSTEYDCVDRNTHALHWARCQMMFSLFLLVLRLRIVNSYFLDACAPQIKSKRYYIMTYDFALTFRNDRVHFCAKKKLSSGPMCPYDMPPLKDFLFDKKTWFIYSERYICEKYKSKISQSIGKLVYFRKMAPTIRPNTNHTKIGALV